MQSKKKLLLLLILLFAIKSYGQISFENGYFISIENEKIECFIKNLDWKNNPSSFVYKLTENGIEKKGTILNVKEFGINIATKYVSRTVFIDESSSFLNSLSIKRRAELKKETLFLKVILEGEANLYKYQNSDTKRFFYNQDNSKIEQLIFKRYKDSEDKIGENNGFRNQLFKDLKCLNNNSKLKKLKYNTKEITNYFIDYNKCKNSKITNYKSKKEKRDLFNLSIRARANSASINISNANSISSNMTFDHAVGFGLGVEAEFIMPFNKNKWAFTMEPTYQTISAEGKRVLGDVELKYSSIEFPIGIRHYFFLSNDAKIFVNANLIIESSFNSGVYNTKTNYQVLNIQARPYAGLGFGYKHKNKFSIELKYHTNKEILGDYVFYATDNKTLSLIIGYSIL